ncbi:MAG: hypothetical protein QXW77_01380 [Candidatus Hadarchaeales archaeon]
MEKNIDRARSLIKRRGENFSQNFLGEGEIFSKLFKQKSKIPPKSLNPQPPILRGGTWRKN